MPLSLYPNTGTLARKAPPPLIVIRPARICRATRRARVPSDVQIFAIRPKSQSFAILHGFRFVSVGHDAQHRAEDFFPSDRHVGSHVIKHCRRIEAVG